MIECRITSQACLPRNLVRVSLLAGLLLCWAIAVTGGMWSLWRHALTPGRGANTKMDWPTDVTISRSLTASTLVMAVHPQCPCSRASVNELATLMARCDGKLTAYVLFAQPAGDETQMQLNPLWKSAVLIPGVRVVPDADGAMVRRFGGQTSGQVFLYDAQGTLQFSGGLTAARGHEGENDGLSAVECIVHHKAPVLTSTPVYGCKIW